VNSGGRDRIGIGREAKSCRCCGCVVGGTDKGLGWRQPRHLYMCGDWPVWAKPDHATAKRAVGAAVLALVPFLGRVVSWVRIGASEDWWMVAPGCDE
jgi:hypothetical protein